MVGLIRCCQTRELVPVSHPVKFTGINNDAAYRRIMTIHVFGRTVGDDICTPLKGTAVDRCRKRIVDNQRYTVRMRCFGKPFNIKHRQCRVGNRFSKDTFGIRPERSFQFLVTAVRINKGKFNTHARHGHMKQIIGSAIDRSGRNHMIASRCQIEYREERSSLPAGCQHCGSSPFQCRDLCGNKVIGRILQSGIEITGSFQIKQFAHVFTGVIFERCALDDGNHPRFTVLRFITGLNAFGFLFHYYCSPPSD